MPYKDPKTPKAIESLKKASKKYYYKNREFEIARAAKYQRENKDRVNKNSVIRRSQKLPVEKVLYNNAKARAKMYGVKFDLTPEDIFVPKYCPVLGVELKVGTRYSKSNSPSVDRINPKGDYTKNNIKIISLRANTIKSDATVSELFLIYQYLLKCENEKIIRERKND